MAMDTTVGSLTLVPHANDITVAATTDTIRAVLNLLSDMAAELADKVLKVLFGCH